jgi:hypothetical protein
MSKFLDIIDNIKTEHGLNNPVEVNKLEKGKYQLIVDELKLNDKKENNEPINYDDIGWGETLTTALGRLLPEAAPYFKKQIEGLTTLLHTPIVETAEVLGKGAYDLASGAVKTASQRAGTSDLRKRPLDKYVSKFSPEEKNAWLTFEKNLYNEWGTEANVKRTLVEKPWEQVEKLALLATGIGKIAGVKLPQKMAMTAVDPLTLVPKTLGLPTKLIKNTPTRLHNRALKLDDTIPDYKKDRMLSVTKNLSLTVKDKSVFKLQDTIDNLGAIKDEAIKTMGETGKVPREKFFKGLDAYQKEILATSPKGAEIVPIIDKMKKSILEAEDMLKRKDMTLAEIEPAKQRHYKELNKFYDKIVSTTEAMPFKEEVVNIMAQNMKTYLEEMIPAMSIGRFNKVTKKLLKKEFGVEDATISQVNELQGALIELKNILKEEVRRAKVGEIMPFQIGQKASTASRFGRMAGGAIGGGALGAGAGYAAGGSTGAQIGYMTGQIAGISLGLIDSSPRIKMSLANFMNAAKKAGIWTHPNAALIRLGLYEAGDYVKSQKE